MAPPLIAAALLAIAWCGGAAAQPVPRVAFFGFELINTSLEPTNPAEQARLRMLDGLFRQQLEATGRFHIVAVPPEVEREIAAGPGIHRCNGCERDAARAIGADRAAWGTVQKVSNLILNINVFMEDAESGDMTFVKSVDIRGNTDESWRHGLLYLLRNYLTGDR